MGWFLLVLIIKKTKAKNENCQTLVGLGWFRSVFVSIMRFKSWYRKLKPILTLESAVGINSALKQSKYLNMDGFATSILLFIIDFNWFQALLVETFKSIFFSSEGASECSKSVRQLDEGKPHQESGIHSSVSALQTRQNKGSEQERIPRFS